MFYRRRVVVLLLSAWFLLAPLLSFAGEFEGKVKLALGSMALVQVKNGIEVVMLDKAATLCNIQGLNLFKRGDSIKVKYSKVIAGVKLAEEVEARPLVYINPQFQITTQELAELFAKGPDGFTLIDSREKEYYDSGHLPGAVSVPDAAFDQRSQELTRNKAALLIFYDEGPRSSLSHNSLRKARSMGYTNLKVYQEGLAAWAAARNHVEVEPAHIKKQLREGGNVLLVDVRPHEKAVTGHIPGAVSVPLEDMKQSDFFSNYWEPPVVFYGEVDKDNRPVLAAQKAIGWGYHEEGNSDAPVGVLKGGFQGWKKQGSRVVEGETTAKSVYIPASGEIAFEEFKSIWDSQGGDKILLDVGRGREFDWVMNIPYDELPLRISRLPKDKEIVAYCTAGYRAMIAYHILKKNGYKVRFLKRYLQIRLDGTLE